MNSHETYLRRLIEEANSALEKANSSADEIKRFYNLSRFFIMINAIKKELMLNEFNEELRKAAEELLAIVEQVARMRDIQGYEGLYAVTEDGRVWSYRRNRFLKPDVVKGYLRVKLCINGKCTNYLIHRLVALAYLPNPDNLPQVNHRDENKLNNCVDNLEWMTSKENANYGTRNERISKAVLCVETNKIYNSIKEAGADTGANVSHISAACKGKQKTCGGFHWCYVDAPKTN